jgi:hypothetical protein
MGRMYMYVDGESHYSMMEKCLQNAYHSNATLDKAQCVGPLNSMRLRPDAKFFWDTRAIGEDCTFGLNRIGQAENPVVRAVYFTVFTGTDENLHEAHKYIRDACFEPQIFREEKDKAKQRANSLKQDGVLVKPKGVDIALAVRMLEDAHYNNFDGCVLVTSDIDYLPVIQSIRRMGKNVFVLGYKEGIAKDFPFFHAVEGFAFVDEALMKARYIL